MTLSFPTRRSSDLNATPVSPMSARHTAFQVPSKSAGLPCSSAWMLRTMVVTIDSIMKPVLGAPVGTGVASTGGIATHTPAARSEEHTSELQSLMRISYAVFCLKKKKNTQHE